MVLDRLADFSSTFCTWAPASWRSSHISLSQALPMVWDFAEAQSFRGQSLAAGRVHSIDVVAAAQRILRPGEAAQVVSEVLQRVCRGPTNLSMQSSQTRPTTTIVLLQPVRFLLCLAETSGRANHPEHFSSQLTPKKREAIMAFYRHDGDRAKSISRSYENLMAAILLKAKRVLKPMRRWSSSTRTSPLRAGATLIDALRAAGLWLSRLGQLDMERDRLEPTPGTLLPWHPQSSSSLVVASTTRNSAPTRTTCGPTC